MHLRSEKFKHMKMFSNTIYTAASFRGTILTHILYQQKAAFLKVLWGPQSGEGKSHATPTDHIHLAILTQFIALHILQK